MAKQSMFGTSFKNLYSKNDLPDLDSLVQIKNRDNSRVRTVVSPIRTERDSSSRGVLGRLQFLATLLGI